MIDGIVYVGAEVKDDILVGKVTPKGVTELTAEEDYYTLSLVKKHVKFVIHHYVCTTVLAVSF